MTKQFGVGGIFPTERLTADNCELVKMYLLPKAAGIEIGRISIEKCIETAKTI